MEIKPGYYRTRDGRKVQVLFVYPPELARPRPVIGIVCCDDGGFYEMDWMKNGLRGVDHVGREDLISEWQEPRVVEGWVNVSEYGFYGWQTKEIALSNNPGGIATRKLRYTEGKGIEDITEEA